MKNSILYIYTTCDRVKFAQEQKKIINDIEYYFVYNKSFSDLCLEPSLKFSDNEVYENISLKTFNCFNHFIESKKDFFIKINDDCVLDVFKLKQNFEYFSNFDVIGGFVKNDYENCSDFDLFKAKFVHCFKLKTLKMSPKKILNIHYPEGSFYILSRKAVEKILLKFKKTDFTQKLNEFIGEDMTIGGFIDYFKSDLKCLDIKLNTDLIMDITKDFISTHPIKPIFMEKFFKLNDSKKIEFLSNINCSNEYVEKEDFLRKLFNEYNKQS